MFQKKIGFFAYLGVPYLGRFFGSAVAGNGILVDEDSQIEKISAAAPSRTSFDDLLFEMQLAVVKEVEGLEND